jgi:hypothetical protein
MINFQSFLALVFKSIFYFQSYEIENFNRFGFFNRGGTTPKGLKKINRGFSGQ